MRHRWLKLGTATAAAMVSALTQGSAVAAVPQTEAQGPAKLYTFAVIGDIPYGDAQIQHFPQVIDHQRRYRRGPG
jgi:hypothetical protein